MYPILSHKLIILDRIIADFSFENSMISNVQSPRNKISKSIDKFIVDSNIRANSFEESREIFIKHKMTFELFPLKNKYCLASCLLFLKINRTQLYLNPRLIVNCSKSFFFGS